MAMNPIQEIELAIRQLPAEERSSLVLRINDIYWDAWDLPLESDFAAGWLDDLIAEAEEDIAEGKVKPLDEILRDS
jgi:hypothetical protein